MEERPNVTVIYQAPTASTPGLGAIIIELLAFFAAAGLIALAGGCAMFWW